MKSISVLIVAIAFCAPAAFAQGPNPATPHHSIVSISICAPGSTIILTVIPMGTTILFRS